MLVDSLVLFQVNYALPVCGSSLSSHLISLLCHLHNQAVRVVFGLQKHDHVSTHLSRLGWLSLESMIQLLAIHKKFHKDQLLSRSVIEPVYTAWYSVPISY